MATERVTVRTCDMCREPDAVTFSISSPAHGQYRVDLCTEHAQPVLDIAMRGKRRGSRRVYSMKEVEAARVRPKRPRRVKA